MGTLVIGVYCCRPVSFTHLWHNRVSWHCIQNFLTLLFLLRVSVRRSQHWVSTEVMASSDEDDQMLNKVEDMRCEEIQHGVRSPRVVPMQEVGHKVLGRVEVIATTHSPKIRT